MSDYETLKRMVAELTYKEGWSFALSDPWVALYASANSSDFRPLGITPTWLKITVVCRDSEQEREITVCHQLKVPGKDPYAIVDQTAGVAA